MVTLVPPGASAYFPPPSAYYLQKKEKLNWFWSLSLTLRPLLLTKQRAFFALLTLNLHSPIGLTASPHHVDQSQGNPCHLYDVMTEMNDLHQSVVRAVINMLSVCVDNLGIELMAIFFSFQTITRGASSLPKKLRLLS